MATLSRRQFLGTTAAAGAATLLAACGGGSKSKSGSGSLKALYMQQAGYPAKDIDAMTTAFMAANPNIKVSNTFVAYEALHDKIVISAPAGTYDVVHMDCIWPAELASKKMIVDVSDRITPTITDGLLPGTWQSVDYDGKHYGLPWAPSTKLFYYNTQLLQQAGVDPASLDTWDGAVAAAKTIKQKGVLDYPFIWSWSQAEAIMCDFAQLLASFGGQFLDSSGEPAFNTGGGLAALEWMKMTLDEGLSDPASTQSLEDDVKKVQLQNRAAMTLNWEYVFPAAQDSTQTPTPGAVTVTTTPKGPGGQAIGVNGGMGLAITAGCKRPDDAWTLIQWMAGEEMGLKYASDNVSVWKSFYTNPDVLKGQEALIQSEEKQQENLINRPNVPNYNAASQIIQAALQKALLGSSSPQAALDSAASQVRNLS
ncbi:MAG: sugar ABC transporter substrate-binding protein [Actinomycetia bacterium]|nr:sugar ABC transporter substrate-binding protein [Actinomycetes bacterium]